MKDTRPITIFCDIDGNLTHHMNLSNLSKPDTKLVVLPGVIDKLLDWERKGYKVILITGRKKSMREQTVKQLAEAGIVYDELIMGIGGGPRYLINDKKDDGTEYAFAINTERNVGINDITII